MKPRVKPYKEKAMINKKAVIFMGAIVFLESYLLQGKAPL
jgi:hypothetical protein